MNDPNDPSATDPGHPLVNELLDGLTPGDPLSEQVESHLNAVGGPVSVDEDEVSLRATRVLAEIRGSGVRDTPPVVLPRRWRRWMVLAAAGLLAVSAWSLRADEAPPVPEVPVAVVVSAAEEAALREDTVVLDHGAVSVRHVGPNELGIHRVYLPNLDVTVEPIGTVYHTGVSGELAVVWVESGRVRLRQGVDGHLGEVGAGGWAVLSSHGRDTGIQVDHHDELDVSGSELDPAVSQLMAEVRWGALSPQTRAGILGERDAP